jgi:demethylmenaquinone methyltransferase/2-methoxy-6-polyprenyl-1,4-benzoquinol methylase
MFAQIAGTYDLLNDLQSLGLHRYWRRRAVGWSGVQQGMAVLDCACGTGDLALAFLRAVGPKGRVEATDFCAPMVALARRKARLQGATVAFRVEDAARLSSPDGAFDVASVAFGIRNMDDPVAALKEMARVVRPGGTVVVLEFGRPAGSFGAAYEAVSRFWMPFWGQLVARHRAAYTYLPQSAAAFPCRDAFLALMGEAGAFTKCRYRTLAFGAVYVYLGRVV